MLHTLTLALVLGAAQMPGIIGNGLVHYSGLGPAAPTLAEVTLGDAHISDDGLQSSDPVWMFDEFSGGSGTIPSAPDEYDFDIQLFEGTSDITFWDYQQDLTAGNLYTFEVDVELTAGLGSMPGAAFFGWASNGSTTYQEDVPTPTGSLQTLSIQVEVVGGTPADDQDELYLWIDTGNPLDAWAGTVKIHDLRIIDDGPA